ncbi:MotE family protein [Anaeromusa acidaminophila]|uniref:MotE family protein n=1 Tax=Anaeromusa acidaminophila TaxID=81464 RepID=UPI000368E64C|nr:hypothetical protein [Anaeromusa acidaminophila]
MAAGKTDVRQNKNKSQDAKNATVEAPVEKKSRIIFLLKLGVALLLVVLLVLLGFGVGVYFKLIDLEDLGKQYGLANVPGIGRYFEQPATNFEPVELPESVTAPALPVVQPPADPALVPPQPKTVPLTEAEKEKMLKKQQQEESKRIGRLARLYGGMKPDEAVGILNRLDDTEVLAIMGKMEEEQVSKILPLFDSSRAARLTQSMMRPAKLE